LLYFQTERFSVIFWGNTQSTKMSLDDLLEPISEESPCGINLEYVDNSFTELEAAAQGKPELQVGDTVKAAVAPDFKAVNEMCEELLKRTKDFRLASHWAVAQAATRGMSGLNDGFDLVIGFVEQYWDFCHPLVEDASSEMEMTSRLNTIAPFSDVNQIFKLLRNTVYAEQRGVASYSVRDVEIALELLQPTAESASEAPTIDFVKRLLTDILEADRSTPLLATEMLAKVRKLDNLLDEKATSGEAPDFSELIARLQPIARIEEECLASFDVTAIESDSERNSTGELETALSGSIRSRSDARRAMSLACDYLERAEPSNPASIFLRRAISLLDKSFLDIVSDLSPESLDGFKKYAPREPSQEN
jgi:type VI secretion system protein ImpA